MFIKSSAFCLLVVWLALACDDDSNSANNAEEISAGDVSAGEVTAGEVTAGDVSAGSEETAGEQEAGDTLMAGEQVAGTEGGTEEAGAEISNGTTEGILCDLSHSTFNEDESVSLTSEATWSCTENVR